MNEIELLLTVKDRFLIKGRGLVVLPLLATTSESGIFEPFSDESLVRRPDETEERLTVTFSKERFSFAGGGKWNIVAMLPNGTKETVPVDSQLFVSKETKRRLRGETSNKG
ncbi:MAG: hypothetical protein EHM45_01730 [Desulfobacteraceae bacterium]|nr:MAG: hypothetical protein EHM45_01730 [Desulfobacteraceae bacterium]